MAVRPLEWLGVQPGQPPAAALAWYGEGSLCVMGNCLSEGPCVWLCLGWVNRLSAGCREGALQSGLGRPSSQSTIVTYGHGKR